MDRVKQLLNNLVQLWSQLGSSQRITVSAAGALVLGGMVALFFWARQPQYQLLYGRLGEKDISEVAAALQEQSVTFEIRGTSVYVPSSEVHRVRMLLASKGVPTGDGVGFEIFDRSNFGISDFVQRTNYLRAIQGELTRTISQMRGVRSARVIIVQPENRLLFSDTVSKPTASVFLDQSGTLSAEAINSVRFLVSNAVEGLQLDDVAVVDSSGNVLSKGLVDDPTLGSANSQMRYRQSVENYLAGKVETMLAAVLGPGNAVVRVSAKVDTETATTTEERWDPDGQVIRSEQSTEDSVITNERDEAGRANAPVGASSNVPNDANGAGADAPKKSSEQSKKDKTLSYEINRTLVNSVKNPGAISGLTAAVFVAAKETPRQPAEIENLRRMVANALGIDSAAAKDLDTIVSLQEVPFEEQAAISSGALVAFLDQWGGLLRTVGAFAFAGVLLLFFVRMLKSAHAAEDVVFEVIKNGRSEAPASDTQISAEMLNQLIRSDGANLGAALRQWATTDNGNRR